MPKYVTIEVPEDIEEREDYIEVLTERMSQAITEVSRQIEAKRKRPTLFHV